MRLRKRDRIVQQIRARDLIDDARSQGLGGGHGLAGRAHLDRHLGTAQTRQSLRAASAGNDAEQHFRLADLGVGRHHAIVAGHRDFKAAAERRAVDGGHQRFGGVLDPQQARVGAFGSRERLFACLQGPENLDVGARDEGRTGADQDHRIDIGVSARARHRGFDAFKNAGAERIDRGIVDGENGDAISHFVTNEFRHWLIDVFEFDRQELPADHMGRNRGLPEMSLRADPE